MSGLDRQTFASVSWVNGEGALHGAADGIHLPDLITRGGRDIIAICLIELGLLTAKERLDWMRNYDPVISAMTIAIHPPFHVNQGGFFIGAHTGCEFARRNVSLDGQKQGREADDLRCFVSGVEFTVREESDSRLKMHRDWPLSRMIYCWSGTCRYVSLIVSKRNLMSQLCLKGHRSTLYRERMSF